MRSTGSAWTNTAEAVVAQSAQSLIRLNGVTKVFYTDEVETRALEDVTLDIVTGEYIAIEGPSGCSK